MPKLKECCNGCKKPVFPPSHVLCEECFKKLGRKIADLSDIFKGKE